MIGIFLLRRLSKRMQEKQKKLKME